MPTIGDRLAEAIDWAVRGRVERRLCPATPIPGALPVPSSTVRLLCELRRRHGGEGGNLKDEAILSPPRKAAPCLRCHSSNPPELTTSTRIAPTC
jgi:hypothetical protein